MSTFYPIVAYTASFLLVIILWPQATADSPPANPLQFWDFSKHTGSRIIASDVSYNMRNMHLQGSATITSEGLHCNDGFANSSLPWFTSGYAPHSIEAKVKFTSLSQLQSGTSPIALVSSYYSTDYFDAITLYVKTYIPGSENADRTKTGYAVTKETLVNEWIHLVTSYDPDANKVIIYRNGVLYYPDRAIQYGVEFMPFRRTRLPSNIYTHVLVCIPHFHAAQSFEGIVAAVAVYDKALTAAQVEANYRYYTGKRVESSDQEDVDQKEVDFPWLFMVFLGVGIVLLFAICRMMHLQLRNQLRAHNKPLSPGRDCDGTELVSAVVDEDHDHEGTNQQSNVNKEQVDNSSKAEVYTPPEAFAFKPKPFPQQEDAKVNRKAPEEDVVVVENEDITVTPTTTSDGMSAIGRMISLIHVVSPSDHQMTPQTVDKVLSYPTPQTAKSIDIISESDNVSVSPHV